MKTKLKIIIPTIIAIAAVIIAAFCISFSPNSSQNIEEMLSTAQKYLIEQNYEQAVIEFNKIIELDPMNPEAYLGLAKAYIDMGNTEKAVETLEKGFELTGDEMLKALLDELTHMDNTLSEPAETILETEPMSGDISFYSDGTVKCRRVPLPEGGYTLEWFEPNSLLSLTETYNDRDKLETVVFHGAVNIRGGYISSEPCIPQLTDDGYEITADHNNGFGKMILSFDNERHLIKETTNFDTIVIEFTYLSDTEIRTEITYELLNDLPYDYSDFEFSADGTGKETFYYDEQAVSYRIYEYDNDRVSKSSLYFLDNSLAGYDVYSYIGEDEWQISLYTADGLKIRDETHSANKIESIGYLKNGEIRNSQTYRCSYDPSNRSITLYINEELISKTEYLREAAKHTYYNNDGTIYQESIDERLGNNKTKTTSNIDNRETIVTITEQIDYDKIKFTHYSEAGDITGYYIHTFISSNIENNFSSYNGFYYESYFPDGKLECKTEDDAWGSGTTIWYNESGHMESKFIDHDDGTREIYNYDDNGNTTSYNRFDKDGNPIN